MPQWYACAMVNRQTELAGDDTVRRDSAADTISRQSNVLPLHTARNEGLFYGRLIRGDRPLSGVQRIGFVLVGLLFCGSAIFILSGAFPQLFGIIGLTAGPMADKTVALAYLPIAALFLFSGLTVIGRAITSKGRKT
jgi:hypothetical protein